MLTIVATPKAFVGHIGIIQRNAITSWTLLEPRCEIILLGDDAGCASLARELGLRHIGGLARNAFGTPLYDDFMNKAQAAARHSWVCHVNADIMLVSDFTRAVGRLRCWREPALMVGRRTGLDVRHPENFACPLWEERLLERVRVEGKPGGPYGVDYFVFPRGMFRDVPAFAVGRFFHDSWPMWAALRAGVPVVDATRAVTAIHQDHHYLHLSKPHQVEPSFVDAVTTMPEHRRNYEILGGEGRRCSIDDATHVMEGEEVRYRIVAPQRMRAVARRMRLVTWRVRLRISPGVHSVRNGVRALWHRAPIPVPIRRHIARARRHIRSLGALLVSSAAHRGLRVAGIPAVPVPARARGSTRVGSSGDGLTEARAGTGVPEAIRQYERVEARERRRTLADLCRRLAEQEYCQKYTLADDGYPVVTPGGQTAEKLAAMGPRFPHNLNGWRVLDIGTNLGYFALEAACRGAAEVVALDPSPVRICLLRDIATHLRLRIEARAEPYSLREDYGEKPFDLVMVGSSYHYLYLQHRNHFELMAALARMTRGVLLFEGPMDLKDDDLRRYVSAVGLDPVAFERDEFNKEVITSAAAASFAVVAEVGPARYLAHRSIWAFERQRAPYVPPYSFPENPPDCTVLDTVYSKRGDDPSDRGTISAIAADGQGTWCLKTVSSDKWQCVDAIRRFERAFPPLHEMRRSVLVRHYGHQLDRTTLRYYQEWVEGFTPLRDPAERGTDLRCEIIATICRVQAQLLDNGLVYVDVHPSNLGTDATGRLRIMDLEGLACVDDAVVMEAYASFYAATLSSLLARDVLGRAFPRERILETLACGLWRARPAPDLVRRLAVEMAGGNAELGDLFVTILSQDPVIFTPAFYGYLSEFVVGLLRHRESARWASEPTRSQA